MGLFFGILQQSGGTVVFKPSDISGLVGWYGDTINGVDRSTLSDGTNITTWDDLSATGTDLTPYSTSYYPTYSTGKTGIYFDYSAGGSGNHGLWKEEAMVSGTGDRTYFGVTWNAASPTTYFMPNYWQEGDGNGGTSILRDYNTYRFLNGYSTFTPTETMSQWNLRTDIVHTDYGSAESRINGSALTEGGSNTNTWNVANDFFYIGTAYNQGGWQTTRKSQFYYREFIAYNKKLTSTEIAQVETWLNTKYSIY